ncbi:hypothetical protein D3C71_2148690 [compost metagenome]
MVLLHFLEQVRRLNVRIFIVGVLHFGTLAEQRVRFIEEQYGIAKLRFLEDFVQVLLGFADVLADDL